MLIADCRHGQKIPVDSLTVEGGILNSHDARLWERWSGERPGAGCVGGAPAAASGSEASPSGEQATGRDRGAGGIAEKQPTTFFCQAPGEGMGNGNVRPFFVKKG